MKFKEIKPGMVIHCPKEEDARALLKHLNSLGYVWLNSTKINPNEYMGDTFGNEDGWYYYLRTGTMKKISSTNVRNVIPKTGCRDGITEFSDLIEPDEPQMSAIEVLKWFRYTDDDTKTKLFDTVTVGGIFHLYTPEQIIDKITAYEAAKKTPELKDVECGWRCEITYADDSADRYDLWGVSEEAARADAKEKAKAYTAKMGRRATVDVWFICRVKEDKS